MPTSPEPRRLPPAASLVLKLGVCGLITWAVYRKLELLGAVATIPLYAFVLAEPIYEFFTGAYRATKEHVLEDVKGRYFQHRGFSIDVLEDDEGDRWLLVRDVRKVLPSLPRDEVLQRLAKDRAQAFPPSTDLRIRADAMVEVLKNAQEPAGVKFKVWVEREVMLGRR